MFFCLSLAKVDFNHVELFQMLSTNSIRGLPFCKQHGRPNNACKVPKIHVGWGFGFGFGFIFIPHTNPTTTFSAATTTLSTSLIGLTTTPTPSFSPALYSSPSCSERLLCGSCSEQRHQEPRLQWLHLHRGTRRTSIGGGWQRQVTAEPSGGNLELGKGLFRNTTAIGYSFSDRSVSQRVLMSGDDFIVYHKRHAIQKERDLTNWHMGSGRERKKRERGGL